MATYYAGIQGANGYKCFVPDSNDLDTVIKEYNSEKLTINSVAIGRAGYYAVVCDNQKQSYRGPDMFRTKMKTLCDEDKNTDIKHITFGPEDTWAITMNSGWVYYYCYGGTSGPLDELKKHNGDIKYVSMSQKKHEWIVGYGHNGIVRQGLNNVDENLDGFLVGLNKSKKSIDLVEIGDDSYFVRHEQGNRYAISSYGNKWCKENNVKTISLL